MKTLPLSEIRKYLSEEEIEKILSKKLLHKNTERKLENSSVCDDWKDKKYIFIGQSSFEPHFSNENWKYYLPLFQKLQPKKLRIESSALTNISGIENIKSLQSVFIGSVTAINGAGYCHYKDLIKMLDNILLLPEIKNVTFGLFEIGTGSVSAHEEFVQRVLKHVQKIKEDAFLDEEKDYYPFTIHFEKTNVLA